MSNGISPSQQYARLLDALYREDDDAMPEQTALWDRHAVFAKAEHYAGRMRFAAARRELERKRGTPRRSIRVDVLARGREILKVLAGREPALSAKYSLAFRNGTTLSDEEVAEILEELQSLGVDLDRISPST